MNTDNSIDFNFTYFALKALGNSLYSNPWVAISELVANGLDADAKEIKVLVDLRNKTDATIEIFDNGTGMTYEDLSSKYSIIGRNRRLEDTSEIKFGRKGVGKLAALYLTSHYFIHTKAKDGYSVWEIDTSKYKDSDIPKMRKIPNHNRNIISGDYWDKFETGTLIQLVNVNLNLIGDKKIESLKVILSDYYLEEYYGGKISVCVLKNEEDKIVFEKTKKKYFFDTYYAMFDTSGDKASKMKPAVYLNGEDEVFPEIDYPRETIVIDTPSTCRGSIRMFDVEGNPIDVKYELKGWIGVNCSLKPETQRRNSPDYEKYVYRGNEVRLYVNGKLAVSNILNLIGSNQVYANYIEGELLFDILDRNDLQDPATSNRESFKLEDPRVQRLVEIISPIIAKLGSARNQIGTFINNQQKELLNAKQAQIEDENKRKRIIEETLDKVLKEKKEVEQANEIALKRLFVLEKNFIGTGESYKQGMHLAVNYAKVIKGKAVSLQKRQNFPDKACFADIVGLSENIIRLNQMIGKAKFSLSSPIITENIISFIKDYLSVVSKPNMKCNFDFQVLSHEARFDFCEMGMALENIISNSSKANATSLLVKSFCQSERVYIEFVDNGKGIDKSIVNLDNIFELGFTTTNGYGIGGYLIKKAFQTVADEITVRGENGFILSFRMK